MAHLELRILTPLLDWKRCSSSQSSPFLSHLLSINKDVKVKWWFAFLLLSSAAFRPLLRGARPPFGGAAFLLFRLASRRSVCVWREENWGGGGRRKKGRFFSTPLWGVVHSLFPCGRCFFLSLCGAASSFGAVQCEMHYHNMSVG